MGRRSQHAQSEPDFVSTDAAAIRLGVTKPTFRRLVGLDPSPITLPGVTEWLRPVWIGSVMCWDSDDLDALRQILAKRIVPKPTDVEPED